MSTDSLGLEVERFRELGHLLVDRVADHWEALGSLPAVREADPEALRTLSRPLPVEGADIEELLAILADHALSNMQQAAHPRYFARVPSPASFAGILGDWLSVGYNAIAASWAGGSGPTQVELVVLDWLRELMGFPPGTEGILVSGGALGNLTALATARAAGYDGAVFISDQTHDSIKRTLALLGVPAAQIRVVPTGPQLRWEASAVEAAIDEADSGRAILVATAGTTNTGAVDPLPQLADLCATHDLWLHVDGCYGAPAAVTDSGRALLRGIERADSLTLDPHKWLFQPYDIGCVLVRRSGALEVCYASNPEYMRDAQATGAQVDFRSRGPEYTRRARAVKLWLTLSAYGTAAIVEAISGCMRLAEAAQSLLEDDPRWTVVTPAQLGVITFADRGCSPAEHVARARRLTEDGFAAVSCTELRGQTVYRLCLINPLTTLADVRETLARLGPSG